MIRDDHEFQEDDFQFAHAADEKLIDKFKILSVADIFAAAIENVYLDKPMSKLYD